MNGPGGVRSERPIANAVLIAGPTASGKSALALDLARRENRVIVNTDSMQVYSGLRVLTARPVEREMAEVPHRLYGHVSPATPYSVGAWVEDVRRLAAGGEFDMRPPIFVGGTGLYFRALCEGLSEMPAIPHDIRRHWRSRWQEDGSQELHDVLHSLDPTAAAALRPQDGQRIVRALEVFEATGRSMTEWRVIGGNPLIDNESARKIVLEPERATLAAQIDARFDRMMASGALEEVESLAAMNLDPAMPAMKAIGVRELLATFGGKLPLAEAVARAKIATRQYAKRQATWFRHQLGREWQRLQAPQALS